MMKILICGAAGLIGTGIVYHGRNFNHEVKKLVRKKTIDIDEIFWSPKEKSVQLEKLEGFDCFINLSGENIANRPWNKSVKSKIYDSRIDTTNFLVECISKLKSPPKVLLSASAIGIYQNSWSPLNENSPLGDTFLSSVCIDWEKEANRASNSNVRVVNLRFAVVLSKHGGILKKMYLPFYLGLGGKLGDGRQLMSWISLDDAVSAIFHAINKEDIFGPINITSKNYLDNKSFTETLAAALNRPAFLNLPANVLRVIFGEMANELFLKSIPAIPEKLLKYEFTFKDTNLKDFLKKEFT